MSATVPRISAEHRELRFVDPGELDALDLHGGYRAAIDAWHRTLPFSASSR
jgi:hypothetical protein